MKGFTGPTKQHMGWKLLKFIAVIIGILSFIPIYHFLLYRYSLYLSKVLGVGTDSVDIGKLGDSLAILGFFSLLYALFQNSKAINLQIIESNLTRHEFAKQMEANEEALNMQRSELQNQIAEMKEQRRVVADANRQRAQAEVMANIRILAENLVVDSKQQTVWKYIERNVIVSSNLSRLIQDALEPLVEIQQGDSTILCDFARDTIEKNKHRLGGMDFSMKYLKGINLVSGSANHADFSGAYLHQANFRNANFYGANFENAKFTDCEGQREEETKTALSTNLADSILIECCFHNASLTEACLRNADCRKANFAHADLMGADFTGADMRSANLSGALIGFTCFNEVDFTGANLTGLFDAKPTDFAGVASLYGAQIDNELNEALKKEFPEKFMKEAESKAFKHHITHFLNGIQIKRTNENSTAVTGVGPR